MISVFLRVSFLIVYCGINNFSSRLKKGESLYELGRLWNNQAEKWQSMEKKCFLGSLLFFLVVTLTAGLVSSKLDSLALPVVTTVLASYWKHTTKLVAWTWQLGMESEIECFSWHCLIMRWVLLSNSTKYLDYRGKRILAVLCLTLRTCKG